jgi:PAS domain S-box-containing protein
MDTNEKVNILLVDDQEAKLISYEVILSTLGENLIKARSAREALEHLLKTDIAVVLMDVSMPEIDGFELADMIRQHPRHQKTAIIFVSAVYMTDVDRLKGYERGAVDYVSVPIIPEILRAKVSVFAELYRKTRQLERLNRELEERVTERTAELEASAVRLRESEARYRHLIQALPVAVYTCDAQGRITLYNEAAVALWGREPQVDKDLWCGSWRIYKPDGTPLPAEESPMAVTVREGRAVRGQEIVIERPDGSRSYVLPYPDPIRDAAGVVVGAVNMLVDLTERKRVEEDQQLLAEARERNRLAQELHDNVAQALGYLNLKMGLSHDLLKANRLDEVGANLRELKQIINETYSDIRSEIFNLRAGPAQEVEFLGTLRRYLEKYKRFYRLDIQLIFEVEESLFDFPGEVSIALIRTIQEALMNVRKHAQVNWACIRLGQAGNEWRISVEDEGRGFDPSKLALEQGSSYGLKIMRERTEEVGGRLEIESTPGRGTRVHLFYVKAEEKK